MSISSLNDGWLVQVPRHALVALSELPERVDLREQNQKQLRRELEALRALYFQLLEKLADAKR